MDIKFLPHKPERDMSVNNMPCWSLYRLFKNKGVVWLRVANGHVSLYSGMFLSDAECDGSIAEEIVGKLEIQR